MTFHPVGQTIGNLPTPLTIANGGTGQATAAAGLSALGGVPLVDAAFIPPDIGLLASNIGDPAIAVGTQITIAGTVYLQKVWIRQAITATNVCYIVTTAGNNTGGSTGTFAGLYSSAGTLLSGSSDIAASLTSTGLATLALTTPQALAAGVFVWAVLLTNLGTTQPTLAKASLPNLQYNAGLAAATFRTAINGTVQTALPSPSITPGSNTQVNAIGFWAGIS